MSTGRLAPSPTGAQHLGNARTYLLAYWSARSTGKKLILRIEDIDSPRVKSWAIQQAIEDLRWLGIDWDEGPDVGGPHSPYIQTERQSLYADALERLIADNLVFPCTCSRQDIADAGSAPHFEHEGNIYPGICASWQNGDPLPEAGTFSWRFRVKDRELDIDDLVLGKQNCNPAAHLGAFPITQKNGSYSYHLACVVDDAAMGVTEVVRGDDLLPSAFRHLELAEALKLPRSHYAHVPLIKGPDGRRLAKRHGDTRLSLYREQGVDPETIVGWAAHSAGLTETAAERSAADVIPLFSWSKINRNSIIVHESETAAWIRS
ncbi:Glutamate--tRNA ligase 1 [Novipirellula galeiformis]|uniref:Glutamate--tRNA ligase 1 n=1 Tax=Novipirellula galeiformis TaxID=2528004 RepID=A0A5C6CD58_9BACT|nr:tRNA glutamyl-Q(34) synthetase GluQRS [Novipirellula galeiformis]TWU21667.1 Glutamate--tRNA ligase 1 [Novipirellula galeiformis]